MQQIKCQRLAAVIAFTLALFDAAASAIAAEKPAKLRTAYVSPIGAMAPVWMAAASSAFQSEGIDVELVYIQSNAAIAALLAGEVDCCADFRPRDHTGGAGGRQCHHDCRTSQPDDLFLPCPEGDQIVGRAARQDRRRRSYRHAQ